MIVHCDKGGEHKACDKCRKLFAVGVDVYGAPREYTYAHAFAMGAGGGDMMLCEECRIKWDTMTKLWLKEAMFVVRDDDRTVWRVVEDDGTIGRKV